MVWALLAAYLTRKPPLTQAVVVGLCCGLFVTAAGEANDRSPLLSHMLLRIGLVGVVAGGLFFLGLHAQGRAARVQAALPLWVMIVYITVWVLSIAAAARALFGDGGFKVAALAVVPIVLLAPTALGCLRQLSTGSKRARHA